jgi:hypothetical protein
MATDNLQEQVRSLLPISSDNLKTKLWLKPWNNFYSLRM